VASLVNPEDASGGKHFATESARMLFLEGRVFLLPMVGEEGFGGEGLWAAVANIRKVREVFVLGVMVRPDPSCSTPAFALWPGWTTLEVTKVSPVEFLPRGLGKNHLGAFGIQMSNETLLGQELHVTLRALERRSALNRLLILFFGNREVISPLQPQLDLRSLLAVLALNAALARRVKDRSLSVL